jgi:alkylation response protein AidB-like acyl-CoA dehydrogenase
LVKLAWTQHHQRLTTLALDVLGPAAMVIDGGWPATWAPEKGPASCIDPAGAGLGDDSASWLADYLVSRAGTIYGGTEQIQRTIVAEFGLGLPK